MPAIPASHRALLDGQFATLATIGPDGRPQLSEVWFLAADDTIGLSLNTSRQKTKNLLANPATNLFLLDLANPYRYLEIRWSSPICIPAARPVFSRVTRCNSSWSASGGVECAAA